MRRLLLALLVLAAVGAAGGVLLVRRAAADRWAAVTERQHALVNRFRSDLPRRERIAPGAAEAGDAWDLYDPAFSALAALGPVEDGRGAEPLSRVRQGARRAEASASFDLDWPTEKSLLGARRASDLLVAAARDRRAARDHEAALDALGDAFQIAVDVGRIPRLMAFAAAAGPLVIGGTDELRAMVAGGATPPAALARLREMAAALDRGLPSSGRAFAGEYAVFNEGCRRFLHDSAAARPSRWAIRRHAFSWRMHLGYLSDNYGVIVESATWRESQDWPQLVAMPWPGEPDFVLRSALPMAVPSWLSAERKVREARARLRLVLAAVADRLGRAPGGPDWPADPFTLRPIHRRADGGRVVLWAEGPDGDQGGAGTWRPAPERGDLVLELPD